jgi:hypothetical protein
VRCATLTDPHPSACRCHQSCDAYAEDMSRYHSILQVTINHLTRLFLFPSLPPTSANSLPPLTTADSTPRPFQVDIPRRSHRHGDVQPWRQEHQLVNPPPLMRTVTTTPWPCSLIPAVPIGGQCLETFPDPIYLLGPGLISRRFQSCQTQRTIHRTSRGASHAYMVASTLDSPTTKDACCAIRNITIAASASTTATFQETSPQQPRNQSLIWRGLIFRTFAGMKFRV